MLGFLSKIVKLTSIVVLSCSIFVSIIINANAQSTVTSTPATGTAGSITSATTTSTSTQNIPSSDEIQIFKGKPLPPEVDKDFTIDWGDAKDGDSVFFNKKTKEVRTVFSDGKTDTQKVDNSKVDATKDIGGNIVRVILIFVAMFIACIMWLGVMLVATFILITAQSFIFFFSLDVSSATWQAVSAQPASVLTSLANILIIGSFVGVALGYLLDIKALKVKLNDFFVGMAIYTILINFSLPLVFAIINIFKGVGDVALFSFTGNTEDPYGNMLAAFMDSFAYGSKSTSGMTSGGVGNIFGQAMGSGTAVLANLSSGWDDGSKGGDNSQTMSILLSYGVYLLILIIVLMAMWKLAKVGLIRFVMMLFCIIVSPITLACGVSPFPALKKVAQMWLNAFVPLLLFYPGIILGFAITGTMVKSFSKAANSSLSGGKVAGNSFVETMSVALGQPISVNAQDAGGTAWGDTLAQIIIPLFAAGALWKMVEFFALQNGPLSKMWNWGSGIAGKAGSWVGKKTLPAVGKALDNTVGAAFTNTRFGAKGKLGAEIKGLESQKDAETDSAKKMALQVKIDKLNADKEAIKGTTVFGRTGLVGAAYLGGTKEQKAEIRSGILRQAGDAVGGFVAVPFTKDKETGKRKNWKTKRGEWREAKEERDFNSALALADAGLYGAIPEKYKELRTMNRGQLALARQKDANGVSRIDRMRNSYVASVGREREGRTSGEIATSEIPYLVSAMNKMTKNADGSYNVGDQEGSIYKLFDRYLAGDRTAKTELANNPAAMAVFKSMVPKMLLDDDAAQEKVRLDFPGLFSPGSAMSKAEENRLNKCVGSDFATLDISSLSQEGKMHLRQKTGFAKWCEQTKNLDKLDELDRAIGGSYGAATSSASVASAREQSVQQQNLPSGSAGYGVPTVDTIDGVVAPALVGVTTEISDRVQKDSTKEVARTLKGWQKNYTGTDLQQKLESMGLKEDSDVAALGISGISTLAQLRADPNLSERLNKITLKKLGEIEDIDAIYAELDANAIANSGELNGKLKITAISPDAVNKLSAARLNSGIEKQMGISMDEGPTKNLITDLRTNGQNAAATKIAGATDLKSRMATVRAIMVENPAAITPAMATQYVNDLIENTELGRGMTPNAAENFSKLATENPVEALKAALVFQESVVGAKNISSSQRVVSDNVQGIAKFKETTTQQAAMLSTFRAGMVQLGGDAGERSRMATTASAMDMVNNLASNGAAAHLGVSTIDGSGVLYGMSAEQQFQYKERFAGIVNETMKLKREQTDLGESRRALERQIAQETDAGAKATQVTELGRIDSQLQAIPSRQSLIHASTVSFMEDAMQSNPSLSTVDRSVILAQAQTNATAMQTLISSEDQRALNTMMAPTLSGEETRAKGVEVAKALGGEFKELVNQSVELGIIKPTAKSAVAEQHVVIQNTQFATGRFAADTTGEVAIRPVIQAAEAIANAEQVLANTPTIDMAAITAAEAARDQAKMALEKVQKEYEQTKAFEMLQSSGLAATDPKYADSYRRITQLDEKAATSGGVTALEKAEKEAIKNRMVQQAIVSEQAELNRRIKAVRDANAYDRVAQADATVSAAEKAKTTAEKAKAKQEFERFKASSIVGTRNAANNIVRKEVAIAGRVVAARTTTTP